jgi:hypothetical protein
MDGDLIGDVCDPDTDGDGVLNTSDLDDDADKVYDAAETPCGGDPLNPARRPERIDGPFGGVDDDGDTSIDEALPPGAAAYDCDGDGYKGSVEASIFSGGGNGDRDACGGNGWPSDLSTAINPNQLNVADLGTFVAPVRRLGTSPGDANFSLRWDLVPGAVIGEHIAVTDMAATITGTTGYPPMLGGIRALGGPVCPWAP